MIEIRERTGGSNPTNRPWIVEGVCRGDRVAGGFFKEATGFDSGSEIVERR
jgi:hypothetical protein